MEVTPHPLLFLPANVMGKWRRALS